MARPLGSKNKKNLPTMKNKALIENNKMVNLTIKMEQRLFALEEKRKKIIDKFLCDIRKYCN